MKHDARIELRNSIDDWLQFERHSDRKVIARRHLRQPFAQNERIVLEQAMTALKAGLISLITRRNDRTKSIIIIAERVK